MAVRAGYCRALNERPWQSASLAYSIASIRRQSNARPIATAVMAGTMAENASPCLATSARACGLQPHLVPGREWCRYAAKEAFSTDYFVSSDDPASYVYE